MAEMKSPVPSGSFSSLLLDCQVWRYEMNGGEQMVTDHYGYTCHHEFLFPYQWSHGFDEKIFTKYVRSCYYLLLPYLPYLTDGQDLVVVCTWSVQGSRYS